MDRDAINRAAKFYAVEEEGQVPAVEVGGVLVNVYVARDGHLMVVIDSSGIEIDELQYDDGVPNLRIVVNEARIYDDSRTSRDAGTAFSVEVTDLKPEPGRLARLAEVTEEMASMPRV